MRNKFSLELTIVFFVALVILTLATVAFIVQLHNDTIAPLTFVYNSVQNPLA